MTGSRCRPSRRWRSTICSSRCPGPPWPRPSKWRRHFDTQSLARWNPQLDGLLQRLGPPAGRQRIVGRKGGLQFHALHLDDIACFVSVDKLTFAVTQAGEHYLVEPTLQGDLLISQERAAAFRAWLEG